MIYYMTHEQIDKNLWDWCIALAPNGNVYAWSWYLDVVYPGWEALVEIKGGKYVTVMPITNKKKYGINYLCQPFFTQQLGVFSVDPLPKEKVLFFLSAIPPQNRLVEIRLNEGQQARIGNVTLKGNNKTNDFVVIREMYSRPGQLFSRSDVTRTVRELATLGFFNQESILPDVQPNYKDNTVDIEYKVEETSADQVSFSAGWGYNMLILQAGLAFNNFSMRNIFHGDAWKPIPGGDGQKLSLNISTYGTRYIYTPLPSLSLGSADASPTHSPPPSTSRSIPTATNARMRTSAFSG